MNPIPQNPGNPAPATPATTNQYQRFLDALPEDFREPCRSRFKDSGLSPDHVIFEYLAEIFAKKSAAVSEPDASKASASTTQPDNQSKIPDFLGEAQLHSQLSKQLLVEFKSVPNSILAEIEPQLRGLVAALNGPVEKLETVTTHLQSHVAFLPKRPAPTPKPDSLWKWPFWWLWELFQTARFTVADHLAWVVTGSISATLALTVIVAVLSVGASHLSRSYEESYQRRLSHLEADSIENTVALNRLLAAGIALKVERNKEGNGYFLILQGAQKAAQPVSSPEGLAVEVWP